MKLTKLAIKNMIGVKHAEITNPQPIVFIAGPNGSGKSSIQNIVATAITEELNRVSLKKDAGALVHEGNDEGSASIEFGTETWMLNINKGKLSRVSNSPEKFADILPYVLNPHKFAADTPADRRRLLLKLSGVKATQEVIAQKMAVRGIYATYIESITPFLVAGFDDALKEAQGYAREAKAAWRTITGEVYGEKKAETWRAKAEGDLEEIRELVLDRESELSTHNAELEEAQQKLGAMKAARDKAATLNADIVRLRDAAERADRIKAKLEIDAQELKRWREKVEQTKMSTHGITQDDTACHCPECGCELVFIAKDKKLISLAGDLHGHEEAAIRLPEYERTLDLYVNSVRNGERDLAAAETAKVQLSALEARNADAPSDEAMIHITAKIDEMKAYKKNLEAKIQELINQEKALREAGAITEKAALHHAQVKEWEKMIGALSPDGVPQELLNEAIQPFKERLPTTAWVANWLAPAIDADMNITVEGRPYALLSESEQWRVDCLITEAISYLSGLKFFAIDRMDVLDGAGRMDLVEFLSQLADEKHIDTVLLTGTMKKEQALSVQLTMENFSVYWMQDGVLSDVSVKTQNEEAMA